MSLMYRRENVVERDAVCDCFHCGLCVLCVCGLLPVFEVGPTEAGGAWDEVEVMFEFS